MITINTDTSKLRLLILHGPTITTNATTPIPSPFPPLLEYLTETAPSDSLDSFVGYTSHPPLHLRTKYYDTRVTIWCDELPPPATNSNNRSIKPDITKDGDEDDESSPAADLAQWQSQMLSQPALEVRSVIGGIILILPITPQQLLLQRSTAGSTPPGGDGAFTEYIQAVHALREAIEEECGLGRDVAGLVVLQLASKSPEPKMNDRLKELVEKFEAWCHDEGIFGLDFVSWDGQFATRRSGSGEGTTESSPEDDNSLSEKNEYGEKVGIHRVREVLEAVDWTVDPENDAGGSDDDDPLSGGEPGLDFLSNRNFSGLDSELQQEIMGLKLSMLDLNPSDGNEEDNDGKNDGEDMSPSQMQDLMERVVAIRDAGVDLPKEERQAFAKREVEKIIRELM